MQVIQKKKKKNTSPFDEIISFSIYAKDIYRSNVASFMVTSFNLIFFIQFVPSFMKNLASEGRM